MSEWWIIIHSVSVNLNVILKSFSGHGTYNLKTFLVSRLSVENCNLTIRNYNQIMNKDFD